MFFARGVTALIALVAGGVLVVACQPDADVEGEGDAEPQGQGVSAVAADRVRNPPDIILIMVDTLRNDRVVCPVDPDEDTLTPNICALLGKVAFRFEPAYAQSSWTRPSVASMLTGLYPHEHRATTKRSRLSTSGPYLAEALQRAGYHTAALVNNPNLHGVFGFDRGFDEFHYLGPGHDLFAGDVPPESLTPLHRERRQAMRNHYRDAQDVTAAAIRWLDATDRRPLFLFITYMDPHDPYIRHPFDGTYHAKSEDPDPSPEVREEYLRAYDDEVAFLDFHLGRFLAALSARGRFRNSVVLLLSDHGEEFHEHNGWFHGETLYEEVVRVPFFIKMPGAGRGGLRSGPVESVDVAPTLLRAAGLPVPEALCGRNVLAKDFRPRPVLMEDLKAGRNLRAMRQGWHKLILAEPETERVPARSLYRLDRDPAETTDRFATQRERALGLRTVMERFSAR